MRLVHVARKPALGTVADVVLAYGTSALHIDACRISVSTEDQEAIKKVGGWARMDYVRPDRDRSVYGGGKGIREEGTLGDGMAYHSKGRWPANVILYGAEILDTESGERLSNMTGRRDPTGIYAHPGRTISRGYGGIGGGGGVVYADSGGASRFFKVIGCE